jgi:AraC-like DNA-binding protein
MRPGLDLVAVATPLKPLMLETDFEGRTIRRLLRQGDIYLQPPLRTLELRLGVTDIIVVFVPTPVVRAIADSMMPGSGVQIAFRHVPRARDTLLSSLVIELCSEIDSESPTGTLYRELLSACLLARIVKRYGLRAIDVSRWGKIGEDARIARTLAFVESKLTRKLRLADVARHVGVSQAHLTELFKAATGKTVWAHVRRRRLELARGLLSRSSLSVAEVADKIGYESAPRFSQAFKATFGVSPAAYRSARGSP